MQNQNFNATLLVDQSPKEVFTAVMNVRGWWSEEIEGNTNKLEDVFSYHYQDVHKCKIKLVDVVPDKRVVWHVLDNYFSFTNDKREWKDTKVIFDIAKVGEQTQLHFTHEGLVPEYECYNACVNGWNQYVLKSLSDLITTGKGAPNASTKARTIHEVAARFNVLAQQEEWFDIQDELFSENVRSLEPAGSPYFKDEEGKSAVRRKGEEWVKRIQAVHRRFTTQPLVAGNHFAVGREVEITVQGFGRIKIDELMLYEVQSGKIVMERFFY